AGATAPRGNPRQGQEKEEDQTQRIRLRQRRRQMPRQGRALLLGDLQGKKPKNGKRDKSRCVAHDKGNCQPGQNKCAGPEIGCSRGVDDTDARFCFTTTGNGEYCSSGSDFGSDSCTKDAECVGDCGVGAACVKCEQDGVVTGRCVGLDISCGLG
ncbi:MAG: hypothetical protein ACRDJC_24825, partial [Thermomicrobiales bacterium]